jgi:hypothetical protein
MLLNLRSKTISFDVFVVGVIHLHSQRSQLGVELTLSEFSFIGYAHLPLSRGAIAVLADSATRPTTIQPGALMLESSLVVVLLIRNAAKGIYLFQVDKLYLKPKPGIAQ